MSSHNFWNSLKFGFISGMFSNTPFCNIGFGSWGSITPFNSCFNPFNNCCFPFRNSLYFYPNVMSTSSFYPLMQDAQMPSFNYFNTDVNSLFPTDNWQVQNFTTFTNFNPPNKSNTDNTIGDSFVKTNPPESEQKTPQVVVPKKSAKPKIQTTKPTPAPTRTTNTRSKVTDTSISHSSSAKLNEKYSGSAEELNNFLNKKNGVLANKGAIFLQAQEKYGVNAAILAAICIHESGYGTSNLAKTKNNVAGISQGMGFKTYKSVDECIMDTARILKSGYINKDLITIEKVGKKYCPVGDPRDTQGINSGWGNAVSRITNSILV